MPFSRALINGERWPDEAGAHVNAHGGGVLRHGGRLWWFGEHKVAGPAGNRAEVGVSAYSSADGLSWRREGVALEASDDPGSPLRRGCVIERPKVLRCPDTGRFAMWFHFEAWGQEGYRTARAGVAVADLPAGPYRLVSLIRPDAGQWPRGEPPADCRPLSEAERTLMESRSHRGDNMEPGDDRLLWRRDHAGGQMSRDQTVFADPAGGAWHVRASEENSTLHVSRLRDGWLGTAGDYWRVFPGGFHEAPCLCRHRGRYWLLTSGCTGWAPNAARLAVADRPEGPWTALGNPCQGPAGPHGGPETTFGGQGACLWRHADGRWIWCLDLWRPGDAEDGRYAWLPLEWEGDRPVVRWRERWEG